MGDVPEMSNLTPRGLKTDVNLNSTWLNLTLDMDIDWSTQGALFATQHLDAFGKVSIITQCPVCD